MDESEQDYNHEQDCDDEYFDLGRLDQNITSQLSKTEARQTKGTQDWSYFSMICPTCEIKMNFKNLNYVCSSCGHMSEDKILDNNATTNQWYSVNDKEKYQNTGKAVQYSNTSDNNLITVMDKQKKDLKTSDAAGLKLNKLKSWQKRNRQNSTYDKNLTTSLNIVQKLSAELMLPRMIVDKVIQRYLVLCDEGFSKGKGVMNLIGALTYLVCKQSNTPILINKILANLSIKKKKLTKTYRAIKKQLEIQTSICSSSSFVSHFTQLMNIPGCNYEDVTAKYDVLQSRLSSELLAGKCPILFTTVCLYLTLSELYAEKIQINKYAAVVSISPSNLKLKLKIYLKVLSNIVDMNEYPNLLKLVDE